MKGSIAKAEELAASIPGSIIAGQFQNPANPAAHYKTTGPEIWEDTEGKLDIFVACAGTGGTVSGTGRFLKEMNPDIRVIAAEPSASPFITEGRAGAHKIQGIGAGFIPDTLDLSVIDETVTVTDDEAYEFTRAVAKTEGILVGISSGAALCAAKKIAEREENRGKRIVVILPDRGERYLSSGVFD
jgi:cysteine synthase A